jgi:predicted phage terminase large subunit-like protein
MPPSPPVTSLSAAERAKARDAIAREIDRRERYERSLGAFLRGAIRQVEPSIAYHDNWHISAVTEHLEAVTRGEIKRLIVNVPPRSLKTSIASIIWPSWVWAQSRKTSLSGPGVQFLCGSHGKDLSFQSANKMRRLVEGRWYQPIWGDRFKLLDDQNTKQRYETDKGGARVSVSVESGLLGFGGQIIIIDDPHDTGEGKIESEADRNRVINWWREISTTRLNDPKTSAIVVIMQRLHQLDVTGFIMENDIDGDYDWLMLPMRHDPARHCVTSIGWEDPRTEDGELLHPDRLGEKEVARMERELGPYMAAGRLQQNPQVKGGGIIKRDFWRPWPPKVFTDSFKASGQRMPVVKYPPMSLIVASLDTAMSTKEESDYHALTIWGIWNADPGVKQAIPDLAMATTMRVSEDERPKIMILHAWRKRLELNGPLEASYRPALNDRGEILTDREWRSPAWLPYRQRHFGLVQHVVQSCRLYKVNHLLIENKTSGQHAKNELVRLFADEEFMVHLINPKGDKRARLLAVEPRFAKEMVYAPVDWSKGTYHSWADEVITECELFPRGAHDDLVDSMTQALIWMRDSGIAIDRDEYDSNAEDVALYRRPLPLPYEV